MSKCVIFNRGHDSSNTFLNSFMNNSVNSHISATDLSAFMYWSNPEKTGNSPDMIEKLLTRMKNVSVRFEIKWQNIKLQSIVKNIQICDKIIKALEGH